MNKEKNENFRDLQYLHNQCKKCMYYHSVLTLKDGRVLDGIIEGVEPDRIIVLIGEDVMEQEAPMQGNDQRQISGFGGGRPRRRYRRFRRRGIPLGSLAALALLNYPYYNQPYPYYYQYPQYYPYYPDHHNHHDDDHDDHHDHDHDDHDHDDYYDY